MLTGQRHGCCTPLPLIWAVGRHWTYAFKLRLCYPYLRVLTC